MRAKQVQRYLVRSKEAHRPVNRHTDFWIGLYGQVWLTSTDVWAKWAHPLMRLKPQKRLYFLRGLHRSLPHSLCFLASLSPLELTWSMIAMQPIAKDVEWF